jgi:uncharacterized protein YukE
VSSRHDGPTPRAGSRPDRPDDPGFQGNQGDDEDVGKRGRTAKKVPWEMYDAPRIWQMVANEGNREAEDLVWAFSKISQYVDDTRLRLTDVSTRLAAGWHGSAAADQAQVLLKEIVDAMVKDTTAYVTATRELDNIVARLAETKQRVAPLYEQWMRLSRIPGEAGSFTAVVVQSDVYQTELEHTNESAREEMRRLDRDLEGARITTVDDFVPSTGVPSTNDLQLAGLGPEAIQAAQGGGLGRGLLSGGGGFGLPPTASVVPGAGGLGGVDAGARISGPMRGAMPGVIGGDAASNRPPAGGMMGGGAGGGAGGANAGQGGGKADTQWTTRHGVSPVIDGTPPPDPSTMGVDDSFDKKQRRK